MFKGCVWRWGSGEGSDWFGENDRDASCGGVLRRTTNGTCLIVLVGYYISGGTCRQLDITTTVCEYVSSWPVRQVVHSFVY